MHSLIMIKQRKSIQRVNLRAIIVHRMLKHAFADIGKTLKVKPKDAYAHAHRGALHIMLEKCKNAMADIDKTLWIDPECWVALENRGELHRVFRHYKKALRDLNKS
jgi:hypothetical protein